MVNYLFSGINKQIGFNETQSKYLKKDIKNNLNIVFISSIFDNYERSDEQYNRILSWFKNIDISFSSSCVIDNRIDKAKAKELVGKANIVYLLGGSPYLQMKSIKEYELVDSIKNVDIVIGVSAGSMNQSKRVVYKDEYEDNQILDYSGLGLVDFNIYPHVEFDDIALLKESFEISNYIPLVLLPNDSFIRLEQNNIEYIGEYYFIKDNEIDMPGCKYEEIKHVGTVSLESDRLLYRKTTKEDIEEFFYLQLNPNLRRYLGTTKLGNNPVKNLTYFDESKYEQKDFYRWTIVKKEDNKLLGTIYLNMHDEKAKIAGIDYWIREDEWGCGYVTEAAKTILDFAFNTLNLNRIESCGAKDNPGTWKVMEKIGLKYEGTRKNAMFYYYGGIQDLVMYGLTREEYLKEHVK